MSFIVPSIIANSVIEIDTKMQDIKITVIYNTCIQRNFKCNICYMDNILFAFQYNVVRQITYLCNRRKDSS